MSIQGDINNALQPALNSTAQYGTAAVGSAGTGQQQAANALNPFVSYGTSAYGSLLSALGIGTNSGQNSATQGYYNSAGQFQSLPSDNTGAFTTNSATGNTNYYTPVGDLIGAKSNYTLNPDGTVKSGSFDYNGPLSPMKENSNAFNVDANQFAQYQKAQQLNDPNSTAYLQAKTAGWTPDMIAQEQAALMKGAGTMTSQDAFNAAVAKNNYYAVSSQPNSTPAQSQQQTTNGIMAQLQASPGYQFMFNQGQAAVSQDAASKGLLGSGAAAQALTQYGQGYAQNYYNNYVNQLQNAVTPGATAAGQLANASTTAGGQATSANTATQKQTGTLQAGNMYVPGLNTSLLGIGTSNL